MTKQLNLARKTHLGSQGTLTVKYQMVGEQPKTFEVFQYAPVAKSKGPQKDVVKKIKEEGNMLIREMSQAYIECFKLINGVVLISYDIKIEGEDLS